MPASPGEVETRVYPAAVLGEIRAADWGSVPDWFSGIGTALSLLVVSIGLLWEIRRRRLDDEKQAAERADLERAQARLVHLSLRPLEDYRVVFDVSNDSGLPIYDLELTVEGIKGPQVSPLMYDPGLPDILKPGEVSSITVSLWARRGASQSEHYVPVVQILDVHDDSLMGIDVIDGKRMVFWEVQEDQPLLLLNCFATFTDAGGRMWKVVNGLRTPERILG